LRRGVRPQQELLHHSETESNWNRT
jgi:hypothetical protein